MMIETTPETLIRTMNLNNQDEQRFALHLIDDPNQLSFDRYAYSRYKYGDTCLAKQFGEELAKVFLNKYEDFLLTTKDEFLAISSPRGLVPPAAYYMFQVFVEKVNRFLQSHNCKVIDEHMIERLGTLAEDYSTLSENERFERLIGERYFIDPQPIGQKHLLFVDDIRITGMHERNIIRLLNTSNIYNRRLFIYYAELINNKIPSSFEHELNRSAITNLNELLPIIDNPSCSFRLNTRVLKEIIRANLPDLHEFLSSINTDLLARLYHACLACNYQNIERFYNSFEYLQHCLDQRQNEENPSTIVIELND